MTTNLAKAKPNVFHTNDQILTYSKFREGDNNQIKEISDCIGKWARDNEMKFNIKKTEQMANNDPISNIVKTDGN